MLHLHYHTRQKNHYHKLLVWLLYFHVLKFYNNKIIFELTSYQSRINRFQCTIITGTLFFNNVDSFKKSLMIYYKKFLTFWSVYQHLLGFHFFCAILIDFLQKMNFSNVPIPLLILFFREQVFLIWKNFSKLSFLRKNFPILFISEFKFFVLNLKLYIL